MRALIVPKIGSPDLMEHLAGVIKKELDELDSRRAESAKCDWLYFLRSPPAQVKRVSPYADETPQDPVAAARAEKAKKDQQREEVIIEEARSARFLHPQKNAWAIATRIELSVKKRGMKAQHRTIYNCLRKHWSRITPELPKSAR